LEKSPAAIFRQPGPLFIAKQPDFAGLLGA
jgi:hypothetical protein